MDDNQIDDDRVYRGAERELLRNALKTSGMSARKAAEKMDISDARLRQIINGYQPVGRGQRIAVVAPEDTLARIAAVLGVTPEQLEKAGRPDAARELRARLDERREFPLEGDWMSIQRSIEEWAADPLMYIPPDDALRLYDDSSLLGELDRRLRALRTRQGDEGAVAWHIGTEGGDGDAEDSGRRSAANQTPAPSPADQLGTVADLPYAADEEEHDIEDEHEDEHP